jgi:signal recognition particle subunit SRP54
MGYDVLLVDTAGRLHIDEELMNELGEIQSLVQPTEILLVADAMTGQDAVKSAGQFDQRLDLTGVVLTKMDGDARGGAALSIKSVTGKPVKFIGIGEKYDAFEAFHPDRMAGRILGMGDVLSLIEKAESVVDQEKAEEMLQKLRQDEFTLEDFLAQLRQLRSLGPLDQLVGMLPKIGPMKGLDNLKVDEKDMAHIEAIICSMTRQERQNFKVINGSRRRRIAAGSGRPVSEVNRLLKQYMQTRKMMKHVSKGFLGKRLPKLGFPM